MLSEEEMSMLLMEYSFPRLGIDHKNVGKLYKNVGKFHST
jgi:hypothetical protein